MTEPLLLANIRIILVNTSHPGNIGSVARAMKTMGITQLYLVSPKLFPHAKATELAAGADDILDHAVVTGSLEQALDPCKLIIGTSVRNRSNPLPCLTPVECGQKVTAAARDCAPVGLLFGTENSGLSNEQLAYCHYQLLIPANPDYCSLNLSAAVQIICYEIYQASLKLNTNREKPLALGTSHYDSLASSQEISLFYQHLERTLEAIGFLQPSNPKHLMLRLKRLFNRAQLEHSEVNILRGILTAVHKQTVKGSRTEE